MRPFLRALRGLTPAALALLVVACGGEYPQSSIDPKSDYAESIHSLYVMVTWITVAILVVVWGVLGYILVRYRARPDSPLPKQTHGHLGMEIAWTIVPSIIVVVIAIPTIRTVFETQRPGSADAYVVDVVGHQFWWEFRYPTGVVTANELHLPVGRPVSLRMRSEDVIHSFWVPKLGGKRDVNPTVARAPAPEGERAPEPRYTWLHFTINEAGVYHGQCAELCGYSHALMGLRVVAESDAELDAWMADWKGAPPQPAVVDSTAVASVPPAPLEGEAALIELGRRTFQGSTCVACHAVQGTPAGGMLGPNLTLLGRRETLVGWLENNPENLARWIASPRSIKPGALMPGVAEEGGNFPATNLSEEQVRAVAAYLWSLGRETAGAP